MTEENLNPIQTGDSDPQGGEPNAPVAPEGGRPEWLDPRFANSDEQAKAYRAAEREMRAKQQEAANYRQMVEAMQAGYRLDPATGQWTAPGAQQTGQQEEPEWDYENPAVSLSKLKESIRKEMASEFRSALDERLGPMVASNANSTVDRVFMEAKRSMGMADLPADLEDEARGIVGQLPMQQRGDPRQVEAAIAMVIGQRLIQGKLLPQGAPTPPTPQGAPGQRVVSSFNLSAGRTAAAAGGEVPRFSTKERAMMQQFGMSEAEWLQHREAQAKDNATEE